MNKEKKWRIIRTRQDFEQNLVKIFMRKEIQSFCPLCSFESNADGHFVIERRPLFASTLFLYIDDDEMKIVKNTSGVINFLYWRNYPAVITHKDISNIYKITSLSGNIRLEKCEINTGWIGKNAFVSEDEEKSEIITDLPSLGFRMIVKKANFYAKELKLKDLQERNVLPAFSLNNSFNLAAV